MKISDTFKTQIDTAFYDKDIYYLVDEDTIDAEGNARRDASVSMDSFKGNVTFEVSDKVREAYGIREDVQMMISTHEDVENGDLLMYNSQTYEVYRVLPNDSHNIILCKEWSSKSSDLTS